MSNPQEFQPQIQIPQTPCSANQPQLIQLNYQTQPPLKEQINTSLFTLKKIIEGCDVLQLTKYLKTETIPKQSLDSCIALVTNIYTSTPEIYQMYNLILKSGADVNTAIRYHGQWTNKIQDKDNITLLMFAVIINDLTLLRIAYEYQPDLSWKDAKGRTALIWGLLYTQGDDPSVISMLIKDKSHVNAKCLWDLNGVFEEHNALTISCFYGFINITKFWIENGVNVNFRTSVTGDTAWHIAMKNGSVGLVRLILECGVDLNIKNNDAMRVVDMAWNDRNECNDIVIEYYQRKGMRDGKSGGISGMNGNNEIVINSNTAIMNNPGMNFSDHDRALSGVEISDNMIWYNQMNNSMNDIPLCNTAHINQMQQTPPLISNTRSMKQSSKTNINININDNKSISNVSHSYNKTCADTQCRGIHSVLDSRSLSGISHWFSLDDKINKSSPCEYNLEFPVAIKQNCLDSSLNVTDLGAHFEMISQPRLTLDITKETFQWELELNTWALQLEEAEQQLHLSHQQLFWRDKEIEKNTEILQLKNKEFECLKAWEHDQWRQLSIETKKNMDLLAQIPDEKYPHKSNKTLDRNAYHECKFTHKKWDEVYIISQLQADLLDYQRLIWAQLSMKKEIAGMLIQNIQDALNELNINCDVKPFGAFATDLCWPWSELDIVLINKSPNVQISALQNGIWILKTLFLKLKTANWLVKCQFKDTSWSSVLEVVTSEKYHHITIAISYQDENHYGLRSVSLVLSYWKEYKVWQPIMFALKTILKNANLNIADTGGLSSYGWTLMLVSYIQSQSDGANNFAEEEFAIGKIFYYFLGHYGLYFDFSKYMIISYKLEPNNSDTIIGNETSWNFDDNNHQLIIVDPLNRNENVAKNTFQFMNLKMAFMIAYMITKEDCECGCHYGKAVRENSYSSTEHCILKRMFNSVKRFSDSTI